MKLISMKYCGGYLTHIDMGIKKIKCSLAILLLMFFGFTSIARGTNDTPMALIDAQIAANAGKSGVYVLDTGTEALLARAWQALSCGCPTACVDKPDLRDLARKWIIVAGSSVDLDNAPEEKLVDIVVQKLK